MTKQEARANAAAAKAYAKSRRNWFARHKVLTALGAVVVLIIVMVAANSGGSGGSGQSATNGSGTSSESKKGSGPTARLPIQNGDWRLDSIRLKNDGLGDFGGTGRVTYTGDDKDGGDNLFTLTVFKGGKDIAALTGAANTVLPGRSVTVQFVSDDAFTPGPYAYDFQNNL